MDRFKKNTGFSVGSPFRRKAYMFNRNEPVFGQKPNVYGGYPYGPSYSPRDLNDPLSQAQAYVMNKKQFRKNNIYFGNQEMPSESEIYEQGYKRYQRQLNEYLNEPLQGGMFGRLRGDKLREFKEANLERMDKKPTLTLGGTKLDRLRRLRNVYKGTHEEIKMTGKSTLGNLSDRPMLPPSMLTYKRKNR